MQRSSVVIMMVLLCYVSVLNFVVVSYLYRHFSTPGAVRAAPGREAADAVQRMVAAAPATPAASDAPGSPATPGTRARGPADEPACGPQTFTDVAVRVRRLASADSNDAAVAPSVRLLADLRQRVLAGHGAGGKAHVRVWLVLRPEDFVALFRLWCVALGADSRGRCQCEVLFTEPAQHRAIAWLVAHRQPCLERLFVLDEGFAVPPRASFSAEVLARAGPDASRLQVLDAAPAGAGRESLLLPGCFVRECVRRRCRLAPGLESDADIAAFAAGAQAGLACRANSA